MSMLVQRVTALLKETQSMEEAVSVLTANFRQLSSKEAKNTVLDVLDFSQKNMVEGELKHRLEQRGLTA